MKCPSANVGAGPPLPSLLLKWTLFSLTTASTRPECPVVIFLDANKTHYIWSFCIQILTISQQLFIQVLLIFPVNLLQPNISFSALDGRSHWWLQGSEVIRGHSFSIICSTQAQPPRGSFHLELSGSRNRTQSAVNHSTTFFFPEADFVHQGNYSCVYEVTVSSRTFNSPTTELLAVTVKGTVTHTSLSLIICSV